MSNGTSADAGSTKGETQGTGAGQAAAFIGAGTDLASSIYGLTQGLKESPESRRARHIWERARPEAERLLAQLFVNPAAEGSFIPYSNNVLFGAAPTQSMSDIYSHYLGRQYGLPSNVASSLRAQALDPVKLPSLPVQATPAQVRRQTALDPRALAGASVGTQLPGIAGGLQKLKSQGQLAAFNLWRAQQLGQIIG
jgi:hypothetical protein